MEAYKERIWLIGKFDNAGNGGINDVWHSTDGVVWKKTEEDPEWRGREDASSAVFKDKIWVLGGMTNDWRWKNDIWYAEFTAQ